MTTHMKVVDAMPKPHVDAQTVPLRRIASALVVCRYTRADAVVNATDTGS